MRNAGLDEGQAGIEIAGRNINNLRYADDTTLCRKQRGTKESFDEGQRGDWGNGLKTQYSKNKDHGIRSHHFMANRWGKMEQWQTILGGSEISADGDCRHEIKRHLLLGKKAMTNLDSIVKSRDITLPTKARIVKPPVFPVVMYRCESWTIKKAENWGTDVFKLWSWKRLWRAPCTARWSNHSILKEINPEYSLEGQMLKLKLQYVRHMMWRADSLGKT